MGRVSLAVTHSLSYPKSEYQMNQMLFYNMRTNSNAVLVCNDTNYNYYSLPINGYLLMFAKNKYRSDGLRLFKLDDELAKCLGFLNYDDMRARTPHLQHCRKFLSTNAIQRAFY